MQIVITTSGIGSRLGDLTKNTNKCLIKVGDKYVIDYIINNYINNDVEFIFTIGYKGDYVKQYIEIVYKNKIKYKFIDVDNFDGPGSSLGFSLLQVKDYITGPFIFHCNDSILYENLNIENINENTLFLFEEFDSSQYSSVNMSNQIINKINEKGELNYDYVYVGVAYIFEYKLFFEILIKLYIDNPNNASLSDIHIYEKMLKCNIKLKGKVIEKYCDIGNMKKYNYANKLFKSNYNVLEKEEESISFVENTVVKFFTDKNINLKRVERTKYFPEGMIPKILNYSDNFFSMELIKGNILCENYNSNLITNLLDYMFLHFWNKSFEDDNFNNICYKFYHDKTIDRINKGLNQKLVVDYNIINNNQIGDIMSLIQKINFNDLCLDNPTPFHGDFILDNIIINEKNEYFLIDWRQDFQGNLEYGDMYYDLAKLRHNLQFNHENIEQKLFSIKHINENSCIVDMKCNFFLMKQLEKFDNYILNKGLNLKKIKILNAIIWINMSPLHTYPLSNFLFNLGKSCLYHELLI
jgi:choline kinase/aminoglycoside phosphotransferase